MCCKSLLPLKRRVSARVAFPCAVFLVVGLEWTTGTLRAQDSGIPAPVPRGGFQIRSISGYAEYYSSSLPNNGGYQPAATNLPSDAGAGGSAVFDWTKFTDRSSFSLSYTPSYTGRVRYS